MSDRDLELKYQNDVALSLFRALLGLATPRLQGVSLQFDGRDVVIHVAVDSPYESLGHDLDALVDGMEIVLMPARPGITTQLYVDSAQPGWSDRDVRPVFRVKDWRPSTMNPIELFTDEVERLLDIASRTLGMAAIEPHLTAVLERMSGNSEETRKEIVDRLIALMNRSDEYPRLGRPGILELVEYTMHGLRWPEIRDELLRIATPESNMAERQVARRILDAYNDDWSNADIYDRYRVD